MPIVFDTTVGDFVKSILCIGPTFQKTHIYFIKSNPEVNEGAVCRGKSP